MIPLPSTLWTHAGVGVICFVTGAGSAWWIQGLRSDSNELERQQAVVEQARKNELRSYSGAATFEVERAKIQTKFIKITEEVERVVQKPVYRNVCLDDDGLRLISDAIDNKPTTTKPESSVP